jgi:formate hydrogenlyase subunit 3/multisubunit Na+/H+ antiporter MnhD subunit
LSEEVAWIVWIVMVPLIGALTAFVSGSRVGPLVAFVSAGGIGVSLVGLIQQVSRHGPVRYPVGGWGAPLGIELYADGLSVVMLLMAAIVGVGITLYSPGYFGSERRRITPIETDSEHAREVFWPLWLFAWGALNASFLSGDVFNLYVTLELLTLSGVALIGLARRQSASIAAFRYLLAALVGSLFYLLGVALLYSEYGTVDWVSLSHVVTASTPTSWAIALMTLGLVTKTALFPLQFWLPPAHGNAPAPVSSLLSALAVKASFYFTLRLWFSVFSDINTSAAGVLLGGLGAAAIIYGSLQALRQRRLKMLVAYSTVAQVGYLFLAFAFLGQPAIALQAWRGAVYYALSHACAKAAMFFAAGAIMRSTGHDNLDELDGIGRHVPMSVFAFGLAGVSLMGLPPSGGFVGKWMLLRAAIEGGQWWMVAVILSGGLLAAAYIFPVVSRAFFNEAAPRDVHTVPRLMEFTSLALALIAIGLGLFARQPLELLEIGSPFSTAAIEELAP